MTRGSDLVAFIDLSGLAADDAAPALVALAREDRLGLVVSRALVAMPAPVRLPALPEGWHVPEASPVQVCQWAFDVAAQADRPLVVLAGGLRPAREVVGALAEALDVDPLFGAAVPRIGAANPTQVHSAPSWHQAGVPIPGRLLALEPEYTVLADVVAPMLLLRRELVGSLACTADGWRVPAGLIADFLVRARRAGFRAVLCNRAVAAAPPSGAVAWALDGHDRALIQRTYPEIERVSPALSGPDLAAAERPLAAALDRPESLLIDVRNLSAVYNGTSAAILGIADGLHRARPDAGVRLWVHEDVAAWHGLASRYPSWTFHHVGTPPAPHAACIRLSQPWHVSELDSIDAAAAVTVYWMLDTIAWDILYTAPDDLDRVWRRMAREADAVLFISEFSRQRFIARFGGPPQLETGVCRLSLAPADYLGAAGTPPEGPYWLVIGNRYDHKHIGPTVDLLARSFPRQKLVVFGDRHPVRTSRVARFDSGPVEEATVQACFAGASLVVFPSFYEGFGLPIVQGLAHGRTVIARASALVHELAARYAGPGRLLTFSTDRELVDLLNRLARGEHAEPVPLGTDASAGSWTWDAAAADMLAAVRAAVARAPSARALERAGIRGRELTHPLRACTTSSSDRR
ncbi:MAG: hypothetical protein R2712_18945 [Vicinamibacterales bacterium]